MNGELQLPADLRAMLDATRRVGRPRLVGGGVRDWLLGLAPKDFDVEVGGVDFETLQRTLAPFGATDIVGRSFGVIKVRSRTTGEEYDFSLPRRESKTGAGHRGFTVAPDPALSDAEAAARRDFTVNAIALDPFTGEIIDPHGGRRDLAARVLRHTSAAFSEDPLRVLRGMQLAARFDFSLAPETAALCLSIAGTFSELPVERVWHEWEKWAQKSIKPSRGLAVLEESGWLKHFPEIAILRGTPQEPEWHPEGDVWVHTLQVIDQARTRVDDLPRPERLAIMLGAVCHDFGKPATTAFIDGRIRSIDHEEQGVAPASAFLDRLNIHSLDGYDVRRQVLGMVAQHLKPGMWFKTRDEVGDGAFRRLAQKVDLQLLARLAKSDCLGREPGQFNCDAMDWFLERARTLGVEHRAPEPLLMGRHLIELGVRPGPRMGEILKTVYEQQLDGAVRSLDEALQVARTLVQLDDGAPAER
jgi:tRNA nucleotidyltransferase (CCA-adding enzyme)